MLLIGIFSTGVTGLCCNERNPRHWDLCLCSVSLQKLWTNEPVFEICPETNKRKTPLYMRQASGSGSSSVKSASASGSTDSILNFFSPRKPSVSKKGESEWILEGADTDNQFPCRLTDAQVHDVCMEFCSVWSTYQRIHCRTRRVMHNRITNGVRDGKAQSAQIVSTDCFVRCCSVS